MNRRKELSWKPVRRGDLYCAPACGGRCTLADFSKASKAAKALARNLGKGWRGRVWENLGWHYEVISPCKRMKVSPGVLHGYYHAFIGEPGSPGGTWSEYGLTARGAILNTLRVARLEVARLHGYVVGLSVPAKAVQS